MRGKDKTFTCREDFEFDLYSAKDASNIMKNLLSEQEDIQDEI